jgi:hypothetical protein
MKKTPPNPDTGASGPPMDPHYLAWFAHFNAGEFYEAHEVLEVLWLRTPGGDKDFFKGLIQVAAAFVHLRKQLERPQHATDSTRLRPAARLFLSGKNHLAPYGPVHLQLNVSAVCALCESLARGIEQSSFTDNPWNPAMPPHIGLAA